MGFKKGLILVIISFAWTIIGNAQTAVYSKAKQIKAAVKAAPAAQRAEVTVFGYSKKGELVKLREGNNSLICLADDPNQSNFHVACYHKDLEPFMSRGRELKAKGYSRKKVDSLRRKEIEAGSLTFPRKPMALYSLTGAKDAYDYSSGMIKKVSPLYVIYVPYATEKSTGLSSKPQTKGAPWLMEPGMPWAHIMVMSTKEIGNSIRN